MSGYIKDYRKELDSDIWLMPPLFHRVWQWVKYSVNHRANEIPFADGSKAFVGPGERITSLRQIAKGVGYYENGVWKEPHVQTIRRILTWLENAGMVQVTCDTKYTHLKVLNWGIYQDSESFRCDSMCTEDVQACTTNKNDKNEKKIEDHLSKTNVFDYQVLVDMYHSLCPSLPKIKKLNANRKSLLKARHKDHGQDGLTTLFKKAEASEFLSGRNGRWKGASFDWLLKDSNALKVLEGNYDNKPSLEKRSRDDYTYEVLQNQDRSRFTFLNDD